MQRRTKLSLKRVGLSAGLVLCLTCAAGLALAEPEVQKDAPAVAAPGAVPLNQLLRLPAGSGAGSQIDRRGGHTKPQWKTRFRAARKAQLEANAAIARTRAALEAKVAADGGGQWRMGAPGVGGLDNTREATESPLDFKLTQQLRRNREELARADRELQDLEVEANLASVPQDWRAVPIEPAPES